VIPAPGSSTGPTTGAVVGTGAGTGVGTGVGAPPRGPDHGAPPTSPRWAARPLSRRLPDFPWDALAPYADRARAHEGGIVDLSVGTPVDPTADVVQQALAAAADSPGYPLTVGRVDARQACVDWLARRFGVTGLGLDGVLPVVGSKELIAALPSQLGLGPGDVVVHPELAYPTYEVGAVLAGARAVAADSLVSLGPQRVDLVWVNSPSNPTGRVLPVAHLRKVVAWCRERGALLVSDECYLETAWDDARRPASVLHPDVCDGDHAGILSVHSLSKRSNLAGYRCAFVAGDAAVVAELLAVRRNLGLMMPGPQQHALRAALDDDRHVEEQHARYRRRRAHLLRGLEEAGFRIDHSEASLYLWATRGESCWDTVDRLAHVGILVAPGAFYGATGGQHVRVALTATDERVAAAVDRLARLR
jgi:succinyldiaminopimelate transaminase